MKKAPHTALLLQQHRLKRELDEARAQRNGERSMARHYRQKADEASSAAAAMDEQLRRNRRIVQALKWSNDRDRETEIRVAIRVPEEQVIFAQDVGYVWEEAMNQLGVHAGTDLRKHSMAAILRAFTRQGRDLTKAKHDWLRSASVYRDYGHLSYEMLSQMWDSIMDALIREARTLAADKS